MTPNIDLRKIAFLLDEAWFVQRAQYWEADLRSEERARETYHDASARTLVGWYDVRLFAALLQNRPIQYVGVVFFNWIDYTSDVFSASRRFQCCHVTVTLGSTPTRRSESFDPWYLSHEVCGLHRNAPSCSHERLRFTAESSGHSSSTTTFGTFARFDCGPTGLRSRSPSWNHPEFLTLRSGGSYGLEERVSLWLKQTGQVSQMFSKPILNETRWSVSVLTMYVV